MTRNIHHDLYRRPTIPAVVLYAYDAGGGINVSAGWTDITFDTVPYVDSNWFSLSAGTATVTINRAGLYEVTYYITTQNTSGSSRSTSEARLVENVGAGFVEIGGTRGGMYNRIANVGLAQASVTIIRHFNATDTLKVQVQRNAGTDTITTYANGCGILVRPILPD